jgi:hypothetical protein
MNNDSHLQRDVLLEELPARWRRWLSLRYRSLAALHPEIVHDASADLVEYLSARLAGPSDPERIREPRSDQPAFAAPGSTLELSQNGGNISSDRLSKACACR